MTTKLLYLSIYQDNFYSSVAKWRPKTKALLAMLASQCGMEDVGHENPLGGTKEFAATTKSDGKF